MAKPLTLVEKRRLRDLIEMKAAMHALGLKNISEEAMLDWRISQALTAKSTSSPAKSKKVNISSGPEERPVVSIDEVERNSLLGRCMAGELVGKEKSGGRSAGRWRGDSFVGGAVVERTRRGSR